MAIYHCPVKPISRQAGMSAPARAAYCSGEKLLKDWHTGVMHERAKGGVEHQEIVLPLEAERRTSLRSQSPMSLSWNATLSSPTHRSRSRRKQILFAVYKKSGALRPHRMQAGYTA